MANGSPSGDVSLDIGISQYAQTTLQTITPTDGARSDVLAQLWNRSDIDSMVLCVVGVFSTSSAGSYSATGRNITTADPGLPFPAGGVYINLFSPQDVKNFRIQAAAGGTVTLVGVAYR
jgi:hypothetical protein